MRKVFLVEDEIVVRENIRDHVPWAEWGFELVGEASDGEMALPLIEEMRPDILITDIRMPFLDGLALSRLVRKTSPWVKIILISGYDEFALARQAISISVTDYLLKPITPEDLLCALKRVGSQIDEEEREKEKLADLNRSLSSGMQVMAERFLCDLSTGLVPPGEAIEKARRFSLDLVGGSYVVAIISPTPASGSDGETMYAEYLKAEDHIERLLQGNAEVLKFSPNLRQTVLIFKGDDPAALEGHCYAMCNSLKYEVERKTACSLKVSVGRVRERIQGIAESYRDASAVSRFDYIFGRSAVVGIADAERANLRSAGPLVHGGGEILECLKRGEHDTLMKGLDVFLSMLDASRLSPFLKGYAVLNLVLSVTGFVEELGGDVGAVMGDLDALAELVRAEEGTGLRGFLARLMDAAFEVREKRRQNKYADIVGKARQFIADSYASPEISLNAVAAHVHVSPSHFSTIFSQETGSTFIEFLTDTRLNRAMELLKSSSFRSSEIAYQVGYKDPHYFSYIFKAKTRMTPTEFRQGKSG